MDYLYNSNVPVSCHAIRVRVVVNYSVRFFSRFYGKFTNFSILFRVLLIFFLLSKIPKHNFANCRQKARQCRTSGRRTVLTVCAAYCHSALYGIDQGHPQRHCQAMAGRRKRRASRELPSSSRQSRLTDMTRSTRNGQLFSCRGRLCRATNCAKHGRPSRSQGTSSSTIKRMPSARASGFDDSIRYTSVATS